MVEKLKRMAESAAALKQGQDAEPHEPPVWDLSDLYASPEDPAFARDMENAAARAAEFRRTFSGTLAGLTGDQLAEMLHVYDDLQNLLCKLGAYAFLRYSENVADPARGAFNQGVREKLDKIGADLVFLGLEFCELADAFWEERFADSEALSRYRAWIEGERLMRPYLLGEPEERLLMEKYSAGPGGWRRLFDETMARLEAEIGGEKLSLQQTLHFFQSSDAAKRQEAAQAVSNALKTQEHLLTFVTNILAKDKEIEDVKRGFKTPVASRNIANRIEDEAVEALLSSVERAYPAISWRYYALKARTFGVEKLHYWDRNAPYITGVEPARIPWSRAKDITLNAYYGFAEEAGKIAEMFFDRRWIHANVQKGKDSGAYSHSCAASEHPYILMNYQGSQRDVMTLAHELGHGVHQYLCRHQGQLLSDTPLTVAETASVFGEQLVFRSLLAEAHGKEERTALLSGKIEDMLNTVVRQTAFCRFEQLVHAARRDGELSADDLAGFWRRTQEAALGPSVTVDPECTIYWAYIPHFVHTPFYVYAYAFGECLVNSLYTLYREKPAGFAPRYLQLLSAGGSKRYNELLEPFGLDPRDPAFWDGGLKLISETIDLLEAEAAKPA